MEGDALSALPRNTKTFLFTLATVSSQGWSSYAPGRPKENSRTWRWTRVGSVMPMPPASPRDRQVIRRRRGLAPPRPSRQDHRAPGGHGHLAAGGVENPRGGDDDGLPPMDDPAGGGQ